MTKELTKDDWFPIPGFDDYFANTQGQIASKKGKNYKLLTIQNSAKQTVRLTNRGNTQKYDVHHLIILTFHQNPHHYPYIKHLNGESWDNRPSNLIWTAEETTYQSLLYSEQKMKAFVDNFLEWKTLDEYPHYYFHPNGTVVSTSTRVVIMKPILKPKPSLILINNNNETGMIQIALLIARCFAPNPKGYTEVVYVDGNDNNVEAPNLKWDVKSPTTLRDLKMEIQDSEMWKPIDPYPGYLISRLGELVSIRLKHYVLMKPVEGQIQTCYRIRDQSGEEQYTIPVQKLLGLAFIPNPNNHNYVAPINGDMSDYDLDNLYWHGNPNGCPEEGWVEVEGFPYYEVSGFGVRNKETKMMLNPIYPKGGGYPNVILRIKNEEVAKTIYIHLVIARNLIPNPNKYPIVNHKDGDHYNYHISNLEWCTHSQNLQHAYDTGLRDGSTSVIMIPTGQEVWKRVEMATNYEVSNTGMIRKYDGMIMKLRSMLGYHMITLTINTVDKKYPLVHRLVAFAFLDTDHLGNPLDPEAVYEVNHKNKIRSDNRVENLEIISVKHHREKDQGKAVVAVNPTTLEIKEYNTIISAAEFINCTVRVMSKLIREQDSKNGWFFFFRDDPDLEEKVEILCE
jgi:hypothetical protein